MNDIIKSIGEIGLVPVVKLENPDLAVPLAIALLEAGLPVIEITYRTQAAEQAIKNIKKELPEMLIGAGTILSIEQVDNAVNAGANFIVSPGFNPRVVEHCLGKNILITPGVSAPTQIEAAIEKGLKLLKFFPAQPLGGVSMLKALAAPYNDIKFIPTGGVNQDNLNSYLKAPFVHACGGSWMVKQDLIASENFKEIKRLSKEAISLMLGFELTHVGFNTEDEKDALVQAEIASKLFDQPIKEGRSSIFTGKQFEFMKNPGPGKHGHIAIATNDIQRAIFYFKRMGIGIIEESQKESNGKLTAVYLEQKLAGFALHLLQK